MLSIFAQVRPSAHCKTSAENLSLSIPFRKIKLVSPRSIESQTMAHSLKAVTPEWRFLLLVSSVVRLNRSLGLSIRDLSNTICTDCIEELFRRRAKAVWDF